MNVVLDIFVRDLPSALLAWSVLALLAVASIGVLAAYTRQSEPQAPAPAPELLQRQQELLTAHAQTLVRKAREATAAAERAAAAARRRREEWLAAQEVAERAWQNYDEADSQARRVLTASALPLPRTPQTPAEYAFRERYLHRSAMSACSHNRLSALELSDALAHREGWDPRRHPIEQEAMLSKMARASLRTAYRRASETEKQAWLATEAATAAAQSLRAAAHTAQMRARRATRRLNPADPAGDGLAPQE
ncbi:hypothetical protein [Catellatospora sp. NPDC049609]|uniref:hypothetical protein n=1 Tax=Catellatospora sp. NPDC049609 TaxID=3155505 RepID=UPI0034209DD2